MGWHLSPNTKADSIGRGWAWITIERPRPFGFATGRSREGGSIPEGFQRLARGKRSATPGTKRQNIYPGGVAESDNAASTGPILKPLRGLDPAFTPHPGCSTPGSSLGSLRDAEPDPPDARSRYQSRRLVYRVAELELSEPSRGGEETPLSASLWKLVEPAPRTGTLATALTSSEAIRAAQLV